MDGQVAQTSTEARARSKQAAETIRRFSAETWSGPAPPHVYIPGRGDRDTVEEPELEPGAPRRCSPCKSSKGCAHRVSTSCLSRTYSRARGVSRRFNVDVRRRILINTPRRLEVPPLLRGGGVAQARRVLRERDGRARDGDVRRRERTRTLPFNLKL